MSCVMDRALIQGLLRGPPMYLPFLTDVRGNNGCGVWVTLNCLLR